MSELTNKHAFCPTCGYHLDAAICMSKDNALPKAGDLSICFRCGTLLEFEEGYFVHELSDKMIQYLAHNEPETYKQLINLRNEIISFVPTKR